MNRGVMSEIGDDITIKRTLAYDKRRLGTGSERAANVNNAIRFNKQSLG